MDKREKLEKLDEKVLDKMLDIFDTSTKSDLDDLRDLNVAVTYLKNNQVITPPKKEGGMGERIKDAIE